MTDSSDTSDSENDHANDQTSDQTEESVQDRLNRETGVIAWAELVRHFARGAVINVTEQLDLLDVAACLARDDTGQLQSWLDSGVVRRASDDDARDWTAREPEFWCVVTAPWVLVQEKTGATPPVIH